VLRFVPFAGGSYTWYALHVHTRAIQVRLGWNKELRWTVPQRIRRSRFCLAAFKIRAIGKITTRYLESRRRTRWRSRLEGSFERSPAEAERSRATFCLRARQDGMGPFPGQRLVTYGNARAARRRRADARAGFPSPGDWCRRNLSSGLGRARGILSATGSKIVCGNARASGK